MNRLLASTALGFMLIAGELAAQTVSSTSATSTVQVASGLTLIRNGDLRFGAMVSPPTAGTVVIAPTAAGTPTYTSVMPVPATTSAALFTAAQTSPGNMHFWISLPQQIFICSGACTPATRMLVDAFTTRNADGTLIDPNCVSTSGIPAGPRGQCPDTKSNDPHPFYVGARLNVGANQGSGVYTGTFNVTVNAF